MVQVKYVGAKPAAFDNVAHSGKMWSGNGDVQEVTAGQARRLIKHPDQWALVNPGDLAEVNSPVVIKTTDEDNNEVEVSEDDLKKPLERMTNAELTAYAKTKFDKVINPRRGKTAILDEIEELSKGIDLL